jgi:hypothetical protein
MMEEQWSTTKIRPHKDGYSRRDSAARARSTPAHACRGWRQLARAGPRLSLSRAATAGESRPAPKPVEGGDGRREQARA